MKRLHKRRKTKTKSPHKDRRGKWSRDPWIRILELLAPMSPVERARCIQATAQFYHGR